MPELLSSHDDHRRDVIEEVIWLTDCGESPEQVARRLGYTSADTLGRVLESGIGSRAESAAAESIDSVREATPAPEKVDQVAAAIARIKEEA